MSWAEEYVYFYDKDRSMLCVYLNNNMLLLIIVQIVLQTYVILNENYVIYRFSATRSLFCFGPLSFVRKCANRILIHPYPLNLYDNASDLYYRLLAVLRRSV